jgi:hypothetical protein
MRSGDDVTSRWIAVGCSGAAKAIPLGTEALEVIIRTAVANDIIRI